MPQPGQVDELTLQLRRAYAASWQRVQAEIAMLETDPQRWRRLNRLREIEQAVAREMRDLDEAAGEWITNQFPKAYALGAEATAGGAFAWSEINRQAVEQLAQDLFQDLLAATRHVTDDVKALVREIGRTESLHTVIGSRTATQGAATMRRILEKRGISAITYADGSEHGLKEYTEVALRTKTAVAYNHGSLAGAPDVRFWEVFDGPKCGFTYHDDPTLALGLIVERDEAFAYPIAHPNCRRAFGPRPDITTSGEAKNAKGQVTADQVAAQIAQDDARRAGQKVRAAKKTKARAQAARARHEAAKAAPSLAVRNAKIRTGQLDTAPHPFARELEAPSAFGVQNLPRPVDLIDRGLTPRQAAAEFNRLAAAETARGLDARAAVSELLDLPAPALPPDLAAIKSQLTAQQKATIRGNMAKLRKKLLGQGIDPDTADLQVRELERNQLLKQGEKLGISGTGVPAAVVQPAAAGLPDIIAEDLKLPAGADPLVLYDAPAGHDVTFGAGARTFGTEWQQLLTRDTDKLIPVRGLTVNGYRVESGLATRRNGITYLLEGDPTDATLRAAFDSVQQTTDTSLAVLPAKFRSEVHGVAALKGANPDDAHWAKVYNRPDFKSSATGGNNRIVFWSGNRINPGILSHEAGHIIDQTLERDAATRGIASGSNAWARAASLDETRSKALVGLIEPTSRGFQITPGVGGVTSYGQVHVREDYAESVRLYLKDRALGTLGSKDGIAVRFHDLFPERAAVLDAAFGNAAPAETEWHKASVVKAKALIKATGTPEQIAARFSAGTFDLMEATSLSNAELLALKDVTVAEITAEAAAKAAAEAERQARAVEAMQAKLAQVKTQLTAQQKATLRGDLSKLRGKLRAEGKTVEEIERAVRERERERLLLHAKRLGIDVDELLGEAPGTFSPTLVEAERAKAEQWVTDGGSRSVGKSSLGTGPSRAKDNIVIELSDRLNNEEDWNRFRSARMKSTGSDVGEFKSLSPTVRHRLLYDEVNERIARWASTSGDNNTGAMAMQMAIHEEFGKVGTVFVRGSAPDFIRGVQEHYAQVGDFYRRFVRVMYEHTQAELKAAGIERVSVYRGMYFQGNTPAWAKRGASNRMHLQPANSFSARKATSQGFGDHLFEASIPRDRVLGSARTGFGCLNEYEYVVLDSDGEAFLRP